MNRTLLLIVFILAACNPYAGLTTPAPAAATATGTAKATSKGNDIVTLAPTPAARTCRVTTGVPAGSLNIRTGPGTSYAVIGLLHEGQAATITDESPRGNWIQIKAGHVTGWVNKLYCIGD